MATAVAARTTRLRVGTSVILLPLHHPVHVAEDVITLDLVSKGRVILGVGIGYQPADFRAFSVPMEENHATPLVTMHGTDAIDSTLLITVGEA